MEYLLYDHECPFCCKIVSRISSLIDGEKISYNNLKSKKAKELIKKYTLEDVKSVIYITHNKKVFIKSSAILNLCRNMKFPYNMLYMLDIIPRSLLDIGYNFIAKNRMQIKI